MSAAEQARLRVSQLTLAEDYLAAYEYLNENDLTPDTAPGAWELLWRRVDDAGVNSLSQYILEDLWAAGTRSSDIAVARARHAIAENRPQDAIDAIEEVYGTHPQEVEVAEILAHALSTTDKQRATSLLQRQSGSDFKTSLSRIDLYRSLNQLQDASEELEIAEAHSPGNPRLTARRARIAEALGDWERALEIWKELASGNSAQTAQAMQFVIRLLVKFERTEEAIRESAKLIASDAAVIDKLRGAAILNQEKLIEELLKTAAQSGLSKLSNAEWEDICQFLIDRGDIGLAAFLADLQLPVGIENLSVLMAASLDQLPQAKGAGIRSPDFQLPFSQAQRTAARAEYRAATHGATTSPDQVLIVNATLAAGGAERQMIPLVQSLLGNGIPPHRIHVAIFSLSKERGHAHFAKGIQELNVHLHDLHNRHVSLKDLPPTIRSLVGALPSILRRDVMALWPILARVAPRVLHGWQDRSSVACAYLGSLVGLNRVVMTARNMKPQDRMIEARHYLPIFNLLKDEEPLRLVANSPQGARDYQEWIGLSTDRVSVLPNGLDTTAHRQIALKNIKRQNARSRNMKHRIVIGGVFRLAANKRPLLWLRTVAAIQEKMDHPVHIRLVGTGPYRTKVEQEALRLGLDNVEFIARLSTPEELYGAMDCLLLMSRVEGTPNVLLEAQSCGLPVIACDVGGVRNCVLTNGPGRGVVLPVGIEPESAAQAATHYLSSALHVGAEERRAFIEEHFSLKRLEQSIREIYGPENCEQIAASPSAATSYE